MHTAAMIEPSASAPPLGNARLAGVLYSFSVVSALTGEFLVGRQWRAATALVAVACYVAVTLLLYRVFLPVSQTLSRLALVFNFAGLALEAVRSNPHGVNLAMVFHGVYCLLIGHLIFTSTLLPRFLGVLMALAGLVWLVNLSPALADSLSPYNSSSACWEKPRRCSGCSPPA